MRGLIFGCGYLGRRVASAWIDRGFEVHAVTRSEANKNRLADLGVHPWIGDVCVPSSLQELPSVDMVLHAVSYDRSSGKTQEEVTLNGTRNIIDAIGLRCGRFLQISTTGVYGQVDGEWVDEGSVCEPTQPSGQWNRQAELVVLERFASIPGGFANVLRLAGIYGPGRLLSRIESLKEGQPLAGRGDAWLNLIHVDDAVSAILACMDRGEPQTTYNVVDDRPVERREYFGLLASLVGAPPPSFDTSRQRERGAGGLNKRCSNRRIRERVAWAPRYSSIETGLPQSLNCSLNTGG